MKDEQKTKAQLIEELDALRAELALTRDVTDRNQSEETLDLSLSLLKATLESTADGILVVDTQGKITSYNQRFLDLWGIPDTLIETKDDDALLDYVMDLLKEPDEFLSKVRELYAHPERDSFDVIEFADGRVFERNSHAQEVKGKILGRVWSFRDVTKRKQAEDRVRDSEALYTSLVENLPLHIFRKGLDERFTFGNGSFCATLNRPLEAIVGKTDFDFYAAELAQKYQQDDQAVMTTGERLHVVEEHPGPDGTMYVEVFKTPLYDASGTIIGIQGLFWDITASKRAEEDRQKLGRQIQVSQKLESLGVLASGIAHDFNNLLTGILGRSGLALAQLPKDSSARKNVQQIETTALRAADLSRQMLAYSGRGKFVVQAIQLSEVMEEMAHLLDVSIGKKCVLKLNFSEELPAVEGDVTQIRQIIMNLIINASEAIGEDGGIITVSTGTKYCDHDFLAESYLDTDLTEGLYVYLEVSDTGSGMTPETQAKLFDPFFTTKFTGRGLGLAAVLGIVRGHSGTIKVYSEVGHGTTFRVFLPASKQNVPPQEESPRETESWHGTGTVLVVDDERTVRELTQEVFEDAGFTVFTASDGVEGVEIFRAHADEISVVVLDLTMPRMDGEEAFREIRKIREDACVILSSGYNELDATDRFSGQGLAGFIQKPYRVDELLDALRQVLQRPDEPGDGTPS